MPLTKLSPLQSRLAASLIASLLLLLLYFTFASPHFAYATDVDSIRPEDHNHERLLERPFLDVDMEELERGEISYEAEFIGVDRGIIGRAPTGNEPKEVINNRLETTNIALGQTVSYIFSNASLYGEKSTTKAFLSPLRIQGRDFEEDELEDDSQESGDLKLKARQSSSNSRTLYISVTACVQPTALDTSIHVPPPQLQLYVSQSANNTNPGPGTSPQDMIELEGGYVMLALNATGDVYFGVFGNNNTQTTYTDHPWEVEIAASIDAPYHYYYDSSDNLSLVDSDTGSALLLAGNPMKLDGDGQNHAKWMDVSTPFSLFARDMSDQSIVGLENSYCAWTKGEPGIQVGSSVAKREVDQLPDEQFYVQGLSGGSKYRAALAMNGNSTSSGSGIVGGGGIVFRATNFSTLSDGNCAVITNLSFCDAVSYAVPSNPTKFPNSTALADFYDNYARQQFGYFQNVLNMTPCETTGSAQYSLARNCDNCTTAYKEWLCAVAIPRCTENSTDSQDYLRVRAMGYPFPNGSYHPDYVELGAQGAFVRNSRNPVIDANVTSGPYKELLPCEDLCYHVVQSCPASMTFDCPLPGSISFNQSYGQINGAFSNSSTGEMTPAHCNYPGPLPSLSAGSLALPSQVLMVLMLVAMGTVYI
ncbi:Calcium influx-promoting protein [Lachnellula hyalina]|uniref:Calcium influx-promoting protein n=1 Tax=Lachnellula hyalina TaxID=1316788 RepID=A0A8H8R1M9_9HELO|nr:Calcium influx-promoting protein [Lachnellula hyalina]TVY26120.1 Calcium influx-promoting protein [Lachnellula hyalina]